MPKGQCAPLRGRDRSETARAIKPLRDAAALGPGGVLWCDVMSEHQTTNLGVGGSNPSGRARNPLLMDTSSVARKAPCRFSGVTRFLHGKRQIGGPVQVGVLAATTNRGVTLRPPERLLIARSLVVLDCPARESDRASWLRLYASSSPP